MEGIIKWTYRGLLLFPIAWIIIAPTWYTWTYTTFEKIPYNDYLYSINDSSGKRKVLDFFMNAGDIVLTGYGISTLVLIIFFSLQLILSKIFELKSLNLKWKYEGIITLSIAVIFLLNIFPGPELIFQSYLNYLLD